MAIQLTDKQISDMGSALIEEGRSRDSWQFESVSIEKEQVDATVNMNTVFVSPTDEGGFHLSVFSAWEICSQLQLIHAHHWAGLKKKTTEGWLLESQSRFKRPIRSQQGIQVEMKILKMKKIRGRVFSSVDCVVSDALGGHFEISLKSALAL